MTLLNDVLDLTKMEAGKMLLECIAFDPRELVESTVRLLAAPAHRKGLEVFCRVDANLPRAVFGDPNRIRQILVNLLGNAIKFTHQGEVSIGLAPLEQPGQSGICLSVCDTGIGIPYAKQELIFESFRQSDNSTTRQYGGTGLGLAISSTPRRADGWRNQC